MRSMMQLKLFVVWLSVFFLPCFAMGQTVYTPLDLSGGFNIDLWCGPIEYAQVKQTWTTDIVELQGYLPEVGFGVIGGRYQSLSNTSAGGSGLVYSYPGSYPSHPYYVSGSEGTPEDGYLLSPSGVPYHLASALGNTTLPGDWTEVADPQGSLWATKANGVMVGCPHRIETWQIASQVIELPAEQKGEYDSVNFVLVAMLNADRARNMQIVALYGVDGSDEEILYSFSTEEGGSGPRADDSVAPVEFAVSYTTTKVYSNDAGPTGAFGTVTGRMFDFDRPIGLDNSKHLWGFRVEDVNPMLNNNARGLVIYAATAMKAQASNVAAVADAGGAQTVYDMDEDGRADVQLDGRASSDSDGVILKYEWFEGGTAMGLGATPQIALGVGEHTLTLTVTDSSLQTSSDTVVVTVSGPPVGAPVADAGLDQSTIDADADFVESVTLDGSDSTDDGTIVSYTWSKGLDVIATGVSPTVSLAVGVHAIELRVVDNDGYYNVDTVTVDVQSSEPIADAGADMFQMADESGDKTVTLDGSGSYDPAGVIVSYVWEEGGSEIAMGEMAEVLLAEGTHDITLTITDDSGFTDSDILTVVIGPYLPPTIYYLDANATGPNYEGTEEDPWQTVEQMQTVLNGKANGGSGDTVVIAPGFYGDLYDGGISGAGLTPLQMQLVPRTDWLKLVAADPENKPVFSYVQVYGDRDAYLELDGLHIYQAYPYKSGNVYVRNATRYLRFRNLEVSTDFSEFSLPTGIYITYNQPSDILIENCHIHHTGIGISHGADDITIRNNEIHDHEGSGIQTGWGSNVVVDGNYVHDQEERFVRLKLFGSFTSGSFTYGENIIQDVTGATGTVYAVHADSLEIYPKNHVVQEFIVGHPVRNEADTALLGAVTDITVSDWTHASGLSIRTSGYTARNNILVRVGSSAAIKTYEVQGGALPFTDMLFENNLIYEALHDHTASFGEIGDNFVLRNNTFIGSPQFVFHSSNDGSGLELYNNVFKSLSIYHTDYLSNVVEDGNVYTFLNVRYPLWTNDAQFPNPSSSIRYQFVIYDDEATFSPFWALFKDPDNKDFSLAAGSAAINMAVAAQATETDILGVARDVLPDAGAYEYNNPGGQVVGKYIFYNNSSFDGNDAAAGMSDDAAIATDKQVLLPGQPASFANYTSYDKGVNGFMVDIFNLPGVLSASDFSFKVGNSSDPSTWADGPAASSVTLRVGAGYNGTDRVTVTLPDGAVKGIWLQVTVLANENTNLDQPEVFYIGNAVGDTGNSMSDAIVDATDEISARNNPRTFMRPAGIEDVNDFNRDGKVDATDQIIARNHVTTMVDDLELISP